ncbi:protein nrt1/ ptr family 5.4 [Quercus suber]|uniref:Protein nrt1/ ptr family 5.4 n=1 Tax=Quercus suber TaxID=58331 RepID=A0AAW0LYJ8_QUESU
MGTLTLGFTSPQKETKLADDEVDMCMQMDIQETNVMVMAQTYKSDNLVRLHPKVISHLRKCKWPIGGISVTNDSPKSLEFVWGCLALLALLFYYFVWARSWGQHNQVFEKAMIIDNIDASSKTRNPWRLCSLNQVEELKLVLRLIPIWFSCIMFTAVQAQLHSYYTIQGSTMIRSIGHLLFEKAMIIDNIDASSKTRNPWRLCSLNQVEELKLVLRLIPIWFSCIMFTAVQAQLHSYYTIQGSTMIRSIGHLHISPVSLQAFVGITVLFAVPFYDRIFVPIARKFTGHPSGIKGLQRIGVGLFLSILNIVVSALVEAKRVSILKKI